MGGMDAQMDDASRMYEGMSPEMLQMMPPKPWVDGCSNDANDAQIKV